MRSFIPASSHNLGEHERDGNDLRCGGLMMRKMEVE